MATRRGGAFAAAMASQAKVALTARTAALNSAASRAGGRSGLGGQNRTVTRGGFNPSGQRLGLKMGSAGSG